LEPVELPVLVSEFGALGFLDRQGEHGGFAFVAEIGEGRQVVAGPFGQRGQNLRVSFQAGEVMLSAGTDL
jgi:hypothetical protein